MALFGLFGGSGGGGGSGGERSVGKAAYTIDHLQSLYERLKNIKNGDEQNRDTMVEVIRQITEALIWGEQNGHDHDFFDFFCEKNILADFVGVLGLARVPKTVKVQLLQTLSMLVQNIRRDTSLYYLFSNNHVNQLISTQFDWSDEEILGYYISFLKSLALRLNGETIKFFFNERAQQFPLFVEAVRFFGHRDQMVRTAVRTTTLQVFSVEDPVMQRFVLERSSCTYFVHLACHLRELWVRLDQAAARAAPGLGSEQAVAALQDASEQQQDLLMYISDVLGFEQAPLSEALARRILRYALFPALMGSLLRAAGLGLSSTGAAPDGAQFAPAAAGTGDAACGSAPEACQLSPACALFVLHQVFDTCGRSRVLMEPLAAALLQPRLPAAYASYCLHAPAPPPTYRATNPDVSGPASSPAVTVTLGPESAKEEWSPEDIDLSEHMLGFNRDEHVDDREAGQVSVRGRFMAYLEGPSDTCVLLAAGVLRACLACRNVLPPALLAETGILPSPQLSQAQELLGHLLAPRASSEAGSPSPKRLSSGNNGEAWVLSTEEEGTENGGSSSSSTGFAGHPLEVPLLVAQALEHHASLRVVVVQALSRLVLDLAAELPSRCPAQIRAALLMPVRRAVRSAARNVRTYLHGSLSDGFLDVFTEEWAARNNAFCGTREACSSVRCLLPAPLGSGGGNSAAGLLGPCPPEWCSPASHSERQHSAKAVRCLLVLRQMQLELSPLVADQLTSMTAELGVAAPALSENDTTATAAPGSAVQPPAVLVTAELPLQPLSPKLASGLMEDPLHMPEESADGYQEGHAFEIGRMDRIVCGVVTREGRHTRYLMFHAYLLLLVQPDLVHPGWAVVRTLAPVRLVDSQIDSKDPRSLRLGIRLPKGASCPSEASPWDASIDDQFRVSIEELRGSSFFLLTLSFENLNRCQFAERHLRKRRVEVRAQIKNNVEAFVERLCS